MKRSSRIERFHRDIVRAIPKFPNNGAAKKALEEKSLASLLISYLGWAFRYVPPRQRTIVIESAASGDDRWGKYEGAIARVLHLAQTGQDLTAYLSLKPHTRGFSIEAEGSPAASDRWADKDFVLNVMGYHHLHLDAAPTKGLRSDLMIFAHVTRDQFTVIGLFDHSAFGSGKMDDEMASEQRRLWSVFNERILRGSSRGSVTALNPIAGSGHPISIVYLAAEIARMVASIDENLDTRKYIELLHENAGRVAPPRPKFFWGMRYLDLILFENINSTAFVIRKGPI